MRLQALQVYQYLTGHNFIQAIPITNLMLNDKIQERKELIRLCCGTARGCPTLTRSEDGTFFIKDDYEGEVKLSVNELKQLAAFVTENVD